MQKIKLADIERDLTLQPPRIDRLGHTYYRKGPLKGSARISRPLSWEEEASPRYPGLSPCWNTISHYINTDGYAYIYRSGRLWAAHRLIYTECFGEIPRGLVVRHKCDNPRCVNPEHLEIGTQHDNIKDMQKRGRARGGKYLAKLNATEAAQIKARLRNQENKTQIASTFNVSRCCINDIQAGRTWKEIQ